MGGKSNPPPAPNYVAAAEAQAEASKELTNIQNFANRPTINTPFGSQTWGTNATTDPATGQTVTSWTQNNTLAPGLQSALNDQLGLQADRSALAGDFMGRVANEYSQPFNWQNLPQMAQLTGPSTLNTGITDYTPGLQTDVSSRANNVVGGFNFGGPQMGVDAMTGDLARTTQNTNLQQRFDPMTQGMRTSTGTAPVATGFDPMQGNIQRGVQNFGLGTDFDAMQGGIQRGVQNFGLNAQFNPMTSDLARTAQTESVQRALTTGDNPALPQFDSSYRDNVARSLMERMQPVHERQQQQLETQLANQGFTVGSEGYTRALADLQQRQAAERYNALDTAGNEAQRLFSMGMGARQQAFNEDVTGGQFANQAAQQAFGQGLSANQFRNQAAQQAFNQSMSAQQAGNQALGQQFQQGLSAGQFGNQATQQAYQQALGARQAQNQALGQQFQQGVTAGQFGNQATQQAYNQAMGANEAFNRAQAQRFGQDLSANQFANQALGQQFSQNMAAGQAGNQAAGQAFQQGLAANQFQNQAAQQAYNQNLGAAQFGNQAQQQLFGQMMNQADLANRATGQQFSQDLASQQFRNQALGQAGALDLQRFNAQNSALAQQQALNQQYAAFQNQLRQQAIAEQMQRRGMSLNEMNALLSGQQVSMPQMPSFVSAQRSETPNILGATQMGYDAALGAYNAQQAGQSNMLGGLFSLGGAALSNPFMFSDRRLKRNIKRIGTHATGVGIYEYTMLGYPQVGVMAQELQAVRPDLVKRHQNGYLMVNYGGL